MVLLLEWEEESSVLTLFTFKSTSLLIEEEEEEVQDVTSSACSCGSCCSCWGLLLLEVDGDATEDCSSLVMVVRLEIELLCRLQQRLLFVSSLGVVVFTR